MIGMNTTVTKNVLPYFISINNKYTRVNIKRLSHLNEYQILTLEEILKNMKEGNYPAMEKNISYLDDKMKEKFNKIKIIKQK